MSEAVRYIIAAVVAYLLGSISFGMLVSKASGGPDLRTVGSHSTGATNTLRVMGTKSGLIVFFADALKAVLACLIGLWLTGRNADGFSYGMLLAGICVVLGHNWPCFFQFKGGKGVASTCGVMLVCFPLQAVICYVITIGVIAATRFVSLGSMTMATLFALLVSLWAAGGNVAVILWSIALAAFCVARHHANIGRLLQGRENKLSFTKHGTQGAKK